MYNSSSINIGANDGFSTISLLSEALKNSGKHLMMGDFNFHHSYGEKTKIKKQHAGAEALLEMMKKNAFELILSISIITGKRKNQFSIIDLIFMSDILREAVVHCDTIKKLNQSSNHISIITTFQMKIDETSITKRKAGKSINSDKLKEVFGFFPKELLNTSTNINRYVKKITRIFQNAIKIEISGAKSSQFVKPYGNDDCAKIVKKARIVKRTGNADRTNFSGEVFEKACKIKKKIIVKTKRAEFRQNIKKATESSKKIGKLVK